jgi:hypothetical protein
MLAGLLAADEPRLKLPQLDVLINPKGFEEFGNCTCFTTQKIKGSFFAHDSGGCDQCGLKTSSLGCRIWGCGGGCVFWLGTPADGLVNLHSSGSPYYCCQVIKSMIFVRPDFERFSFDLN